MAKAKKAFAFFLALAMFTFSFLNVSAQTITNTTENPLVCYDSTSIIQPRLKYFESVFCGIQLKNGNISVSGDFTTFASGIDVQFAVGIEKKSGSTWKPVKSNSNIYSPAYGSYLLGTTLTNPASGTYRGVATALALNSKGTIVESIVVRTTKTVTV